MDQSKIGKFISIKRKEKNLTQLELADKLGVTDRTISNWENGKNMPDLSLFKPLCDILDISINEFLSGEEITDEDYNDKLEENLINTISYVENKDKNLNLFRTIILLLLSVIGIVLNNIFVNDIESKNYINIVCLIVLIYYLKQLAVKYKLFRRIMALILVIVCIFCFILI